eukprot:UN02719
MFEAELRQRLAEVLDKNSKEGENAWSYISLITEHLSTIVPNLRIFINDLHLCIEDTEKFIVGLKVEKLVSYPCCSLFDVYKNVY